jgi:hypothetical protein
MSRRIKLGSQEHTRVLANDNPEFNANHEYLVVAVEENSPGTSAILAEIKFQKGPTKENNLNGIFHEDLIIILIDRLTSLNDSEYRCKENSCAITKLEEAQMWLRKRTEDRRNRGVLGTSQK